MEEEYNSLLENQTWDLVPLPSGRKLVRCKWVYRTKSAADGQITRRKARLVAKGFQQVHDIDYDQTFAPVAKMDSICLTLAIGAAQGWEVHQMDVKNAFLHIDLLEEIYMEQPHGFIHDSSLVCRLKKSLYSLKQAPRAWYAKMDSFLLSQNFERSRLQPLLQSRGPCMVRLEGGGDTPLVDNTLYRQPVGSLLYLTHSRPHLSYAIGEVSRYMQEPHELHRNAAKRILQYVQGTITFGIHYAAGTALNILGFTDFDWAGDNIDRKSTSGYSLSLGSGPICGRASSRLLLLSLQLRSSTED
eukprot:PITA_03503